MVKSGALSALKSQQFTLLHIPQLHSIATWCHLQHEQRTWKKKARLELGPLLGVLVEEGKSYHTAPRYSECAMLACLIFWHNTYCLYYVKKPPNI